MDVDMKKLLAIIIFIVLISLFSGCINKREGEIGPLTREFIKDYIKNPETIQYNNERIYMPGPTSWNVYGSGTVMYEGIRSPFSYWIFVVDSDGELNCILKELIIGDA